MNVIVDNTIGSIVCVLKFGYVEPKLSGIDVLKSHGGIVVWVAEQMRDRLWNSNFSMTLDLVIDLQNHASTIYSVGG